MRMPLPPPPCAALIISGNPIRAPSRASTSADWSSPVYPGTTGTPAAAIRSLAPALLPMRRIDAADGPMNTSPAAATASAKSAFSDRNPYPGWIACAPARKATSMIASPRRYDSCGVGPPMAYPSSASRTCCASASAEENTATVDIPIRRQVRITRQAISPRLAISTFSNIWSSLLTRITRIKADKGGSSDEFADSPSYFRARTEVQEQSDLDSGRAQVIHQLHLMSLRKLLCCLDFDDQLVGDQQVCAELADD